MPIVLSSVKDESTAMQALQQVELELLNDLNALNTKQSGVIDELKSLIEKTGLIESKERKLSEQIKDLQDLRDQIRQHPDQANTLVKESGLIDGEVHVEPQVEVQAVTVEPVAVEPVPTLPTTPQQTTTQPAVTPEGPKPIPPVSSTTPVLSTVATTAPVEQMATQPRDVITVLRDTYSQANPAIVSILIPGAQVYTTPDKSIIVEHAGNAVLFSAADAVQAGLTDIDLAPLPQKTTQHLPQPALQQNAPTQQPTQQVAEQPTIQPIEQPVPQSTPQTTLSEKLKTLPNPELQQALAAGGQLFHSNDANGIVVVAGQQQIHVSDAELIQVGCTGEDLVNIPNLPAAQAPVQEMPQQPAQVAGPTITMPTADLSSTPPAPVQAPPTI